MNLARFTEQRQTTWAELAGLVDDAGRRPESLGADGVRRLGTLYRAASADLALARRSFPGEPITARLEHLVAAARHLVYDSERGRLSIRAFYRDHYWRRVLERPRLLALSAALLLLPAVIVGVWADRDPGRASGLVPAAYQSVTEPRPQGTDLGLSPGAESALATTIFVNNIEVTFLALAGGIALGIGAAVVLVQNGILLGAVAGLAAQSGNGRPLIELVLAHGVLELSCIAVAGAAGMRLGWSLVEPGLRTRRAALADEARAAAEIVLGTAPWLVLAGLTEGFITPAGLGLLPVAAIGLALAGAFWSLVLWRGRTPSGSRADGPARVQGQRRALRFARR